MGQPATQEGELSRELGLFGAVVTGLGSIIGTGVFVSIAVAFGLFGREVLFAVPLAAVVATFNGLSSAQLAAAHPVSGGTYEYAYRLLDPQVGFAAGWLFLIAKTASAATAALGFAGYLSARMILGPEATLGLAVAAALLVTGLILSGIRRTSIANAVMVSVTVGSLVTFVVAGWSGDHDVGTLTGTTDFSSRSLLGATAFLFVAYTGYGRIATLGEEVRDPARTIPRAVITTLVVSAMLYSAVAVTAWRIAGPALGSATSSAAPLADMVSDPWAQIVEIGAIIAMLGVLLNLILGLSRVWLAMGRRRDMPHRLAHIGPTGSPTAAVVLTGITVAIVALIGDVRTTWSFSAFAVLLYYAITNAAALRLDETQRRFPRWTAWIGLGSCVFLSFWVDPITWVAGVALAALGLTGRWIISAARSH